MRACLVELGLSPERVVQLVGEGRATLAFAEDGELEDAEARPMAPWGRPHEAPQASPQTDQ